MSVSASVINGGETMELAAAVIIIQRDCYGGSVDGSKSAAGRGREMKMDAKPLVRNGRRGL